MAKPISPQEAENQKLNSLPDEVIESFNELIIENFVNGYSTFKQNDVINRMKTKLSISREQIFDKHYLDVEKVFSKAGWEVRYEYPDRDQSFDSYFTFKKQRRTD